MKFKNKIVLVTGASQNTGVHIAKKFLQEGAKVMINADKKDCLESARAFLAGSFPDRLISFVADISDEDAVKAMFEEIDRRFGRIDILVNNACNQGMGPAFHEVAPAEFVEVVRVNLVGTYLVSHYAVNRMLKQDDRGVIVNISSNVSDRAIHNRAAYVASKSGVDGLTKAMAVDLGPLGIRVNAVAPGYIHTTRWDALSEDVKRRRRSNIPLGFESNGEEIADAVLFLASAAARSINGTRVVVDGGCAAQHLPADVDL